MCHIAFCQCCGYIVVQLALKGSAVECEAGEMKIRTSKSPWQLEKDQGRVPDPAGGV